MDFTSEILSFATDKLGGICIVAMGSGEIVFADTFYEKKYGKSVVGESSDDVFLWLAECPTLKVDEKPQEWEYIDTDTKNYYKVESAAFEKDGKNYSIHKMSDITEYMVLNRDVTKYMAFFKKLSAFQNAVLERLSESYYELLPMLADYFKTNKVYMFLQKSENLDIISYSSFGKQFSTDRIDMNEKNTAVFEMSQEDDVLNSNLPDEIKEIFERNGVNMDGAMRPISSGEVSGNKYALYLNVWANMDEQAVKEPTLRSVIRLYIENGIMREKLLYDSEHDMLTGLYNKAKYLTMMEKEYSTLNTIGIFNMDLNYLKQMNDNYGHEMGDKLLIKAANSIRKVTNNRVHGYRVGGDEYMIIVENPTREEVDAVKDRWEKELERLNTLDDGVKCVIAVGICYGEGNYDLPALLKEADELMYKDKVSKKKPGEEIR